MLATPDTQQFIDYFGGAGTMHISGQSHDVDIYYLAEASPDYQLEALRWATYIHENMPEGDILLFIPGIAEIERTCVRLRDATSGLEVLPLYSALPNAEQRKVNEVSSARRCIVTTNIVETSLTVGGIVYVIGMLISTGLEP